MTPSALTLSFTSLEEAVHALPGIIRTLPAGCQPQIKVLTDAILATAIREQIAAEPRVPPFDLSRFPELRHRRVSTLSPTDAQYMLRATVSFLLLGLMDRFEKGDKISEGHGFAQTLQSLMRIYELTPEMIANEAIATFNAIDSL